MPHHTQGGRWRREAWQHLEAARQAEADGGEDEQAYHEQDAHALQRGAWELELEWTEFAMRENERLQRRVGKLPRE